MAEENHETRTMPERTYQIPPGDTNVPPMRKLTNLYGGKTLLKRLCEAVQASGEITYTGIMTRTG